MCKCPLASNAKLFSQKCEGPALKKCQKLSDRAAERADRHSDGHSRVYTGDVVWCCTGGSYADKKANGMGTVCKGAPARGRTYGGMWGQLHKLMRGCHPKTGEDMDNHTNVDGTPWRPGKGTYANLKKEGQGE